MKKTKKGKHVHTPSLVEQKVCRYRKHRPRRVARRKFHSSPTGTVPHELSTSEPISSYILELFGLKTVDPKPDVTNTVKVPKVFSFYENFDECIDFFSELISAFAFVKGRIYLNFSNCERVCLSTLTLVKIFIDEFDYIRKGNKERIKITPSFKHIKVKKYLHAFGFYSYTDFSDEDGSVLPLDLIQGKYRNSYVENTKAAAIQMIVEFINRSFEPINKCLSPNGLNMIQYLTSEILNNAEDHSYKNSEWYVKGIAFDEKQLDEKIVELNLSIMNFGDSMYQGFENTKELNHTNYEKVERLYTRHHSLFTPKETFERESLFVLYMLNEGISRLKYEDSSRGNGTMQFIEAFTLLGGFGDQNPNFNALLNVISGSTVLSCDNTVKPYQKENELEGKHLILSLNQEKDLYLLPDKNYLKHNKKFFPGAIIECKIYLNEQFFDEVLKNGQE